MNKYELLAMRIEATYAAQSIQARVWDPITVTPAYVQFDFTVGINVRAAKVLGLHEEVAFNLGVKDVRIYRTGGLYHVEMPRTDAKRGVLLTTLLRTIRPVPRDTALLGLQADNKPLMLRISEMTPHAMLSGTTGSGKTALLRTILVSLALYNPPGRLALVLIDPKDRGLAPLAPLPHIWRGSGIVSHPAAAVAMLEALVEEMERRDRLNRSLPLIVVAIDELADLLQSGGKVIGDLIERLTQRGREAGIAVFVATQRPAATLVGSMIKANLPARFVGLVVSPEDAKIATGRGGTGAERLHGRGDFLLVCGQDVIRFQAAYAERTVLDGLVALAASRVVAGQVQKTRNWSNLPLELPAALPRPTPAAMPPGLGQGYLGRQSAAEQGDRDAYPQAAPLALPPVSEALRGAVGDGAGNGNGIPLRAAPAARDVPTGAGETATPISHSPSPIPTSRPVAGLPTHSFARGKRAATRPAPRGEGSRLRERYSPAQRLAALDEAQGNRTLACKSLYGYCDTATLRLMAEAVAEAEAQAADAAEQEKESES